MTNIISHFEPFIHSAYTTRMLQPYLNSEYSKYAKGAPLHYFCTIALQTSYAPTIIGVGCIHTRVGLIHLLSK